jgi:putative addiction module killer protein
MIEIRMTELFSGWFDRLRDEQAKRRILARIRLAGSGHFGDVKPVGEGVSEMRVHCGPGYRLYFVRRGLKMIVLLAGGDKSTQSKDIDVALQLARNL